MFEWVWAKPHVLLPKKQGYSWSDWCRWGSLDFLYAIISAQTLWLSLQTSITHKSTHTDTDLHTDTNTYTRTDRILSLIWLPTINMYTLLIKIIIFDVYISFFPVCMSRSNAYCQCPDEFCNHQLRYKCTPIHVKLGALCMLYVCVCVCLFSVYTKCESQIYISIWLFVFLLILLLLFHVFDLFIHVNKLVQLKGERAPYNTEMFRSENYWNAI